MNERMDNEPAHNNPVEELAAGSMSVVPVGLDDGYAYTKVALPDGRLFACLQEPGWVPPV